MPGTATRVGLICRNEHGPLSTHRHGERRYRNEYGKSTAWPLFIRLIRVRTTSAILTDADSTTTNELDIMTMIIRFVTRIRHGRHQGDPALLRLKRPYDSAAVDNEPNDPRPVYQNTNPQVVHEIRSHQFHPLNSTAFRS